MVGTAGEQGKQDWSLLGGMAPNAGSCSTSPAWLRQGQESSEGLPVPLWLPRPCPLLGQVGRVHREETQCCATGAAVAGSTRLAAMVGAAGEQDRCLLGGRSSRGCLL